MFQFDEIARVCGGRLIAEEKGRLVSAVSTDSRTIRPGALFVALRGARFDGHRFLEEAFQKGAAVALVDHPLDCLYPLVVVDDTLKALHRLARFYRAQFSIPVVAVAGSAGKTTTKECIGILLSEMFQVRIGFGNWNNHIGVPLNLFELSAGDQCLVLEFGANHAGEIALLAEIAQPTVGVITGIHPVHLEGFGSLEGIYQAKLELADGLDRTRGTVIANGDDPELVRRLKGRHFSFITFGTNQDCHYRMSDLIAQGGFIYFRVNETLEFRLNGYGAFNAQNALAAIATAGHFNLDLNSLSQFWRVFPMIEGRFRFDQWQSHNIRIVDDSYNANPVSFGQAVESFQTLTGNGRKVAVVGDMLELGEQARYYHEALGRRLAEGGFHLVIGVGPLSRFVLEAFENLHPRGKTVHFDKVLEAGTFLISILQEGDSVLIKGSHGMRLDKIKQFLAEYFRRATAFV